jgi:hypothetical protein
MTDFQDIRLVIKIENKHPIELFDLTKSFVSLASQFNSYTEKHADSKENREAKLYVKEIRSGSVILELVELATIGIIPFIENTNTIVQFVQHFKSIANYFLKNEGSKPELCSTDYKDFSTILNPVAKDNGSQFNMSTTINGNVELHFHIDSMESNALQNMFKKELDQLRLPEQINEITSSVLLTWFQARNDTKSEFGNKGVIEEISQKPLNITFDNEEIKEKILHSDINPFNTVYVVDINIQTIQDRPVAYKIVRLHDHFDIKENEE